MANRRWMVLGALLVGTAPGSAQDHTTGKFHGCPPEGRGGDVALSELKNRDLPPDSFDDVKLGDFLRNRPRAAIAMGKRAREKWTAAALESIQDLEATGARVEGRLIALRSQGAEACNCGSTRDVDTHIWIATRASASAKPRSSMVVEISPRLSGDHAGWEKSQLLALARQGARVRVSGWVTWDHEHGSEVGKSRGTLWEIHPIHRIEVFRSGEWVDLDDLQ